LTPLPTAVKNAKPAAVHEIVAFDLDNPDWALFDTFHEKLKDAIKRSPEFAQASGQSVIQSAHATEDDIPF